MNTKSNVWFNLMELVGILNVETRIEKTFIEQHVFNAGINVS